MARTMAEVQAASKAAAEAKERYRLQQERIRQAEQARAEREQREREERLAAKAAERKAKAEQRKAAAGPKAPAYQPGDGLTHETGKKRLNVEREGGCVCGCGEMPEKRRSRFVPGHDARMYKLAKAYKGKLGPEMQAAVRETITDRQKSYLKGRNLI